MQQNNKISSLQFLPKRKPYPKISLKYFKKIQIATNLYPISYSKTTPIHVYMIESQPQLGLDTKTQWRKLINKQKKELKQQVQMICHRSQFIWGSKLARLPFTIKTKDGAVQYTLLIRHVRTYQQVDLKQKDIDLPKILQCFSVKLKQTIIGNLKMDQLAKDKFHYLQGKQTKILAQKTCGITVTPCYLLKIIPLFKQFSLLVQSTVRIISTANALQILKQKRLCDQPNYLQGKTLMTNYNKRFYQVLQVNYNLTPCSTFKDQNNNDKSYKDYFSQRYKQKIIDLKQPLLRVCIGKIILKENGKKIKKNIQGYIVPELCLVTGIPQQIRKDFNQNRRLMQACKIKPKDRIQRESQLIKKLVQKNQFISSNNNKCIKVQGYEMNQVQIQIQAKDKFKTDMGSFILKRKIFQPLKLQKQQLAIVYSSYHQKYDEVQRNKVVKFAQTLKYAGQIYGITIKDPLYVAVQYNQLQCWLQQLQYCKKKQSRFIILFFSIQDSKTYYGKLKNKLINQFKIPSQVVIKKIMQKQKNSTTICSKILLQMNAKIGNTIWKINSQIDQYCQGLMYGGISVSKSGKQKKYTLALSGTLSKSMDKYYSSGKYSVTKQQFLSGTIYQQLFKNWIKKYQANNNNKLPNKIIIYRQGISASQIKQQCSRQMRSLLIVIEQAKKVHPSWNPKIMYVMVNQKTFVRFYRSTQKNQGKFTPQYQNIYPGTVVFDERLNNDGKHQFYLVAHTSQAQNTVKVNRYEVICTNDINIQLGSLARFTYQQCFNYYNWQGSIKIPSCLKGSDKLAKLIGQYIKQSIVQKKQKQQIEITNTPYFL